PSPERRSPQCPADTGRAASSGIPPDPTRPGVPGPNANASTEGVKTKRPGETVPRCRPNGRGLNCTQRTELSSAAAAVWRYTGLRDPHARRKLASLPENIDGHAAARIPIARHPDEFGLDRRLDALADLDGGVFMETAGVAETVQKQL